mmetsp:Transcript_6336/g.9754  ORF Transcript_6336/g.9754 Transcript_6336/m.9754 type:complete len:1240 (+) Transcript_6336:352-4071(+)
MSCLNERKEASHLLRKLQFLYNEAGKFAPTRLDELTNEKLVAMYNLVENSSFSVGINRKELLRSMVQSVVANICDSVTAQAIHLRAKRAFQAMRKHRNSKRCLKIASRVVKFASKPADGAKTAATSASGSSDARCETPRHAHVRRVATVLLENQELKTRCKRIKRQRDATETELNVERKENDRVKARLFKETRRCEQLNQENKTLKLKLREDPNRTRRKIERQLSAAERNTETLKRDMEKLKRKREADLEKIVEEFDSTVATMERAHDREILDLEAKAEQVIWDLKRKFAWSQRAVTVGEKRKNEMSAEMEDLQKAHSRSLKAAEEVNESLKRKVARFKRDATIFNRDIALDESKPGYSNAPQLSRAVTRSLQHLKIIAGGSAARFRDILRSIFSKEEFVEAALGQTACERRVASSLLANLKDSFALMGKSSAKEENWKAHQSALAACAPPSFVGSEVTSSAFAKVLGVGHKSLKEAAKRKRGWMASPQTELLHQGSRKESKNLFGKLHPGRVKAILEFWNDPEHVRMIPGLSVVKQHYDADGTKRRYHKRNHCSPLCKEHAVFEMKSTGATLYKRFLESKRAFAAGIQSKSDCSLKQFQKHRPWYVVEQKERSCGCLYHQQWAHLLEASHREGLKLHGNCNCSCDFCRGGACKSHKVTLSTDAYFDHLYCEGHREGNPAEHLMGDCKDCGYDKALVNCCPMEQTANHQVYWKEVGRFETVNVETKSGLATKEHNEDVKQTGTYQQLRERLRCCLNESNYKWGAGNKEWSQAEPFCIHRLVDKHQSETLKAQIRNLESKRNCMVAIIDYAMNHSHQRPSELQSEFFSHWQTTILPVVVYRYVPSQELVWAETFLVVTPDLNHDNAMVQVCLLDLAKHYKAVYEEEGLSLKHIHCWSDGARNQFRLKCHYGFATAFPTLTTAAGLPENISLHLHFFQSCHGKGPSDSENHSAKTSLRAKERAGHYLGGEGSKRAADHLRDSISWPDKIDPATGKIKSSCVKMMHTIRKRFIQYYPFGRVRRKRAIKVSGAGPRNATEHYCFQCPSSQVGELAYGWLSCSCSACMEGKPSDCSNKEIVNYRNGRGRRKTERLQINLRIASAGLPGGDGEAGAVRPRVARRGNTLSRIRRNTRFVRSIRAAEGEGFTLKLCIATEHPQEGGMVPYNYYVDSEHEGEPRRVVERDHSETHFCEIDDVLRPLNFRLQKITAARVLPEKYAITARLEQMLEQTRASVANGDAFYV